MMLTGTTPAESESGIFKKQEKWLRDKVYVKKKKAMGTFLILNIDGKKSAQWKYFEQWYKYCTRAQCGGQGVPF